MKCIVIIPAAGVGKRLGNQVPKQYLDLNGIPIIIRTLQIIDQIPEIEDVVLVIDPEWQSFVDNKLYKYKIKKYPLFVKGGSERQDSVSNALELNQVINSDIILVHDAVRPFASPDLFRRVIEETANYGTVVPGINLPDTIKMISKDNFVDVTISRSMLKGIQTPQGFTKDILIKAYKDAKEKHLIATDDASLVEKTGNKVKIIEGEEFNLKITTQFDLLVAEAYSNYNDNR